MPEHSQCCCGECELERDLEAMSDADRAAHFAEQDLLVTDLEDGRWNNDYEVESMWRTP